MDKNFHASAYIGINYFIRLIKLKTTYFWRLRVVFIVKKNTKKSGHVKSKNRRKIIEHFSSLFLVSAFFWCSFLINVVYSFWFPVHGDFCLKRSTEGVCWFMILRKKMLDICVCAVIYYPFFRFVYVSILNFMFKCVSFSSFLFRAYVVINFLCRFLLSKFYWTLKHKTWPKVIKRDKTKQIYWRN